MENVSFRITKVGLFEHDKNDVEQLKVLLVVLYNKIGRV